MKKIIGTECVCIYWECECGNYNYMIGEQFFSKKSELNTQCDNCLEDYIITNY